VVLLHEGPNQRLEDVGAVSNHCAPVADIKSKKVKTEADIEKE
jgi:hypothetical protein